MKTSDRISLRYTTFYLVMLILSSIEISFVLLMTLLGIPEFIDQYQASPGFGVAALIGSIVMLINAIAIGLLWFKKNPFGIWLLLGTYASSLLTTIAELLLSEPIIEDFIKRTASDSQDISPEMNEALSNTLVYGSYIVGIIITIALAILWWFAYQSQKRADLSR